MQPGMQPDGQPMPDAADVRACCRRPQPNVPGNPYQTQPAAAGRPSGRRVPGPGWSGPTRTLAVGARTFYACTSSRRVSRARASPRAYFRSGLESLHERQPAGGARRRIRGARRLPPGARSLDWDYYPTYIAKLDAVRALARRAAAGRRACSTPGAAKACWSTSTPAGSRSRASTRNYSSDARHARAR